MWKMGSTKIDLYLHIGDGTLILKRDVIGIFDSDRATVAAETKRYLKNMQNAGALVSVTDEVPRAFLLTCKSSKRGCRGICAGIGKIFFSQISPGALSKR